MLLLFIIFVTSLLEFAHEIIKPLQIFLQKPTRNELLIQSKLSEERKLLCTIPMQKEYTSYVKQERKIKALETHLEQILVQRQSSIKYLVIKYGLGYILKCLLWTILVITSLYYYYTPALVFDQRFNFSPFGKFIRFPTNIDGAVSVPFFIFISKNAFQSIKDFLK